LTGLVVTGTYSDGTSKAETVSASNVSGYNADTLGTQTLTVTVSGKTATFTVTVSAAGAATLQSIAITSQPTKTDYMVGESLDLTGLVVTGTYLDGTSQVETVGASNVSGYNADTAGTQTLTVTVNDKTATFSVTVTASTPHFTISLDDPINGVESDIALSRSGAGETPASIELAITGTYAAYEWYLNIAQTPVSSTATWTVNAADCLLGKNFLTVQVRTSDGAYYAKELTVSVSR
jgi:hypothetical protein